MNSTRVRSHSMRFIQILPKAELHLHLEGAIPWEMVRSSSAVPLPDTPPWWASDFVFDDFASDFTDAIRLCYRPVLTSVDRYHQAARIIFTGLAEQNVRYVEISFSPRFALTHGFPIPDVVDAIQHAAPEGLIVAVYAAIARDNDAQLDDRLMQAILETPALTGIDLCGDERKSAPAPYAQFFAQAGKRGLKLKAHAGELAGPESVKGSLDDLGVRRIEHGTTSIGDASLVERLKIEGITLDMCPTSNLKLRAVEKITAHPIRTLHNLGVRVTVNTDDPTIFGCSLSSELALLESELDFGLHELAQLEMNAFQVADMPATRREEALEGVRRVLRDT